MAQACDLKAGDFVLTLGDAHLYANHMEQAREQLGRAPGPLPKLKLNSETRSIFDFRYDDISIADYQAQAHIKARVAV